MRHSNAVKNTSWLIGERVVAIGVNLFVFIYLAKLLGPELYGTLAYVVALVGIVAPLCSLGLNGIVTRELVESPERKAIIMATATGIRLMGAVLGFALVMLWVFLLSQVDHEQRLLFAILALGNVFTAFNVNEFYFQAQVESKYVAVMRTVLMIVFALLKLWVAFSSQNLLYMVGVFALELMLIGLGFIVLLHWKAAISGLKQFDLQYGFQLLKQCYWLIFSSIAAVLYLKIDQVMLANMVDVKAVGIYSVAARLSEVWYFFAEALVVSFFPMLIKEKTQGNSDQYHRHLQRICDMLFMSSFCLALVVTLFANPLVPFLFGSEYAQAAGLLSIHIWAGVFIYMRALASKWLLSERLLFYSLVSQGSGALLNIVLNLWLIPEYGFYGAAWATVISYGVASYFIFWLATDTRGIARIMTRSLLLIPTLGKRYWKPISLV